MRSLAEISRKIAIRARRLFDVELEQSRERRGFVKKRFFTKRNEKKVVFLLKEENFAFVGFLGGGT